MTRANANALFQDLRKPPNFNRSITIHSGDPEDVLLKKARTEIRQALRVAFGQFRNYLATESELFEGRTYDAWEVGSKINALRIRFLTQGSHTYGTLVRPAQPEIQEIDLDDGLYIPMPFINGRPVFSSKALFGVVEKALEPLLKKRGWQLKRKNTCVRIVLVGDNAHIDVPIFAVEDNDFLRVSDNFETRFGEGFRKASLLNELFVADQRARYRLEDGKIQLAHRRKDWIASDPKALQDWFEDRVQRYGEVLRRLSRYSKSWRDHVWGECVLSSVAIMVVCAETLESLGDEPAEDRDDVLMQRVANHLVVALRRKVIANPVGSTPLDVDWTDQQRTELISATTTLCGRLQTAFNDCYDRQIVVKELRICFGNRFPDAPTAVEIISERQTEEVRSTSPATVAMPLVGTSVSA